MMSDKSGLDKVEQDELGLSKLEQALKRLNSILPLKANQDQCDPQLKLLHQEMLRSFVTRGRMLTEDEMSQWVGDVLAAIDVLRQRDMVACTTSGDLIGVYPFTVEERVHSVRINGYQVHAMCALDALAIAPMFQQATQITSRCQLTGDPINIQMKGESILNLADVRHVTFGIAWGAADSGSCCADSLCMEMVFLRDEETAQAWFSDDPESRELFTLLEAAQFSSRFFVPLLS